MKQYTVELRFPRLTAVQGEAVDGQLREMTRKLLEVANVIAAPAEIVLLTDDYFRGRIEIGVTGAIAPLDSYLYPECDSTTIATKKAAAAAFLQKRRRAGK